MNTQVPTKLKMVFESVKKERLAKAWNFFLFSCFVTKVRSKLRDDSIDALVFLKKYYKTKWIILILCWLYVCKIYSHSIHITKSLKSCLYGITIKISIPRFPDPDSPRNYFEFPVPRGMKKWHSPIPRGMKSAGELEPLPLVISLRA